MKVAVTGSKGLVGSHLVKALQERGDEIVEWDYQCGNDIKDFTLNGCDYVVHLAAHANVRLSFEDPNKYWLNNCINTKHIQEQCHYNRVPLLYASSSSIHNWWKSPYGTTKKVNEITAFADRQTGLRFTTVYGPGARDTMFITKLVQGTLKYSTNHVRDFIHVDDVVDCILLMMEKDIRTLAPVYDIGTGKGHTVSELAEIAGYGHLPIEAGNECEAETNVADLTAVSKLGWEAKRSVVDYVIANCQPA